MKIDYAKPFCTVEEHIDKLQARGMVIDDIYKCGHYLKKIGYYRLSGYWYPMRQSRQTTTASGPTTEVLDNFRETVNFKQVVDIYVFDKRLRMLMLDVIERIEIALRTDIVILLGERDRWAHRNPATYDGNFTSTENLDDDEKSPFQTLIETFDYVEMRANRKEDFVGHFKTKYNQEIPIWAALELLDFGSLSVLLSGLKYSDQKTLAAKYGISSPPLLPSWIKTLSYIRNICAHHSRLWNRHMIAEPRQPKVNDVRLLNHIALVKRSSERFYSAAAIARYFQIRISPDSTWGQRFIELVNTFPAAPGLDIRNAGFPENWQNEDLWTRGPRLLAAIPADTVAARA